MSKIDLNKLNNIVEKPKAKTSEGKGMFDFLNKDIKLFGGSFNDKKKERFYSELNILFSSGVDIRSALELIEEEQSKEKDKQLFAEIKDAIVAGSSFSEAIKQAGVFSNYEYYSIQIGEESGRLIDVLQELAVFFSKKIQQKRQLTSALSYPVVVFVASFGAIYFMLNMVVPMFSDVFKRFNGELPYFTQLIIRLSNGMSHYSLYIFLFFIAIGVLMYTQRNAIWYRKYGAMIVLHLPIMNNIIRQIYLARFCQSMNLLISSKTPLVTSIELVEKMVGFYPIEVSLKNIREDVMQGQPLHISMSKFKIYNIRMLSLIKVAEEVNQLDTMFARIAKQYSDEVDHQSSILGSLIEPVMVIFLGLLVAVILVAMYLPLFQMGNTVG